MHLNSGRIPFWSPNQLRADPHAVWVAVLNTLKVYSYKREMYNGLWRLHEGDFKACCYHSSIPVRLGAKRIFVDHGIRVALGCRQIPGPVDHGGFNPPIDRRPPR